MNSSRVHRRTPSRAPQPPVATMTQAEAAASAEENLVVARQTQAFYTVGHLAFLTAVTWVLTHVFGVLSAFSRPLFWSMLCAVFLRPIRVDAKVALLLLEAMPEGPVSVIARFAYAARCPIIDARPVEDEKILAAVRCMKM